VFAGAESQSPCCWGRRHMRRSLPIWTPCSFLATLSVPLSVSNAISADWLSKRKGRGLCPELG
jgi:hypothetical protein